MIKQALLVFFLSVLSGAICAQQTDPCAGLMDSAVAQCRANRQTLQQQHLEQQLQQQQQRQNQLDEQQRQIQQQLEDMRVQNEVLRKQLEQQKSASQPAQPPAAGYSKPPELNSWKSDNPWFGSDYAKTEFAMRYAKQLQKERPDLIGRPFLDAISAKVNETFAAKK